MSARHRCSDDVHRTENVSVDFESAGAFVLSIFGVITFPACKAGLTGVSWIHVHDFDARQFSFVLNELGKAIEAPVMEISFVFTACSCRLADASEVFKLNGGDVIRFGEIHNLSGYLMVFVSHPPLFFVVHLFDDFGLLGLAKSFSFSSGHALHVLVFASVAEESNLRFVGSCHRGNFQTQVHAHDG